jgi:hypothetical protein
VLKTERESIIDYVKLIVKMLKWFVLVMGVALVFTITYSSMHKGKKDSLSTLQDDLIELEAMRDAALIKGYTVLADIYGDAIMQVQELMRQSTPEEKV